VTHDDRIETAHVRERFEGIFGRQPEGIAFAPGRVNLIGEHTDYNDGFVLPMAINRGAVAAFAPTATGTMRVHAVVFGDTHVFSVSALKGTPPRHVAGWAGYVEGVAWALLDAGLPLRPIDVAIDSDLPIGAGLSSSAALELSVARALTAAAGVEWDPIAMARAGQRAEHEFAGVPCGIMDELASAAAVEDAAILIDCRSLEVRQVPLPAGVAIAIMDTGVRRELTAGHYAERRASCERAVAAIQTVAAHVRALRDVDEALLSRCRDLLSPTDFRRASHVVAENSRTVAAADAFAAADVHCAAQLMNASHESLRELYEVSSAELDAIVEVARAHHGCRGARMTGAGFGGCAVALIDATEVNSFSTDVARAYQRATGREGMVFVSRPSAGARLL
jgi:galactokinase